MNDEMIRQMEEDIYSWYWAKNSPGPAMAHSLMQHFVNYAEPKTCIRDGVELRRGQYRFVAKPLYESMHLSKQSFETLIHTLSIHKLITKQYQSKKRATIITVCNYNSYITCKNKSKNKTDTKQTQSHMTLRKDKGTRDNNIINNNRKVDVEAENYYLDNQQRGGAPARACRRNSGGELPIYNEIAEIANDRPWLEALAMNYHKKSVEEIMPMFALFRNECLASGRTRHDSITDCKSHFNNWYRIQLQRKAENGKRKNEYPTREEQTETALEAIRMLDEEG